jgi:hypothetical protein
MTGNQCKTWRSKGSKNVRCQEKTDGHVKMDWTAADEAAHERHCQRRRIWRNGWREGHVLDESRSRTPEVMLKQTFGALTGTWSRATLATGNVQGMKGGDSASLDQNWDYLGG